MSTANQLLTLKSPDRSPVIVNLQSIVYVDYERNDENADGDHYVIYFVDGTAIYIDKTSWEILKDMGIANL